MAKEWHCSRDGKDFGPVTSAELKQLAATGKLLRTDLLWKEGMAEWKPAGEIQKLFPEEDAASVIVVTAEPAKDALASLKVDVASTGKRVTKATTAPSSRKASGNRKSQKSGGAKAWLMYGGAAFICLMILGAFAEKKPPPKPTPNGGGGGGVVGAGGNTERTAAKPKRQSSVREELAEIEQAAYEQARKEGASQGRQWAERVREAMASGSADGTIGIVQEQADFYSRQRDISIRAVEDYERDWGKPCEKPSYFNARGRVRGLYDGFMSEAGEFVR